LKAPLCIFRIYKNRFRRQTKNTNIPDNDSSSI
jgi:hypothetical protein